jgi:hypothetical protein
MRRLFLFTALIGAAAPAVVPPAAHAATTDEHLGHGLLRLCVAEGAGQIQVEGDRVSRQTSTLNDRCSRPLRMPGGRYAVQAGKYLTAPCYQTSGNGDLVNPPVRVTNGARCPGKVHDIFVEHGYGPAIALAGDQVEVRVGRHRVTTVTFHVTDVRYFDCVAENSPAPSGTVCGPTGDTAPTAP